MPYRVFVICTCGHWIGCEYASTESEAEEIAKKYRKGKKLDGYTIDHAIVEQVV